MIEFITGYFTLRAMWLALGVLLFNIILIQRAMEIDRINNKEK